MKLVKSNHQQVHITLMSLRRLVVKGQGQPVMVTEVTESTEWI